jgi:1-aminocyclopropane-1-carboxylate deaminase/D-cysteine desulfhydrase-like pyridoxal-dependent ACC family enzyme
MLPTTARGLQRCELALWRRRRSGTVTHARQPPPGGCCFAHGSSAAALDALLARTPWLLPHAGSSITTLPVPGGTLRCVRDDLLHPHITGNKARKLDGLLPSLVAAGVSDVLTCGGVHSAHAAAVAAAAAGAGVRAHLLLRGERPDVLTGHALLATLFASSVTYVSRDAYADRAALLAAGAAALRRRRGGAVVGVVPEGAACAAGVLGVLRGVRAWSAGGLDAARRAVLVVDSGTGATAWGLALGCALLRLPWRVVGVTAAADAADCDARCAALAADWDATHAAATPELAAPPHVPLTWAPPPPPPPQGPDTQAAARRHRFGTPRPGDVAACRHLAARHGILTDPVWGLHAYRAAAALLDRAVQQGATTTGGDCEDEVVIWVHTGGACGALDGVAQRFPQLLAAETRDVPLL